MLNNASMSKATDNHSSSRPHPPTSVALLFKIPTTYYPLVPVKILLTRQHHFEAETRIVSSASDSLEDKIEDDFNFIISSVYSEDFLIYSFENFVAAIRTPPRLLQHTKVVSAEYPISRLNLELSVLNRISIFLLGSCEQFQFPFQQ